MDQAKSMTKKELRQQLNVPYKTFQNWLNRDYYQELVKLGYRKSQKVFTPCQVQFLMSNIVEFSE